MAGGSHRHQVSACRGCAGHRYHKTEVHPPSPVQGIAGVDVHEAEEFEDIAISLEASGDHDDFNFNSTTGELTFKAPPTSRISPTAIRDSGTTHEDVTIEIPVLDNDSVDQTAKPLSVVTVMAAATDGSSAVLDSESNTITYTPSPNFHGADRFSYTITDKATPARTDTATVRVRVLPVNDPPVAVADPDFPWAKTSENTALDVPAERPLDNDWDPEGDHLTVTEVGIPEIPLNGAAVWDPMTQTITYTPRPNYHGSDTFSYTVSDGNDTADSTVTVTIRQDSADADLAALAIVTGALSPLTLAPEFATDETSYEVDSVVPLSVDKVQVKPTTNDTAATMTVNGIAVASERIVATSS